MSGAAPRDPVHVEDGRELWRSGRCRLEIREAGPGVFLAVVAGRIEPGVVPPVLAFMERLLARPSWPHAYFDLERVEGYDPAVVDPVRQWTKAHRHDLGPMHLYSRSRLVRAGVALANYKLRGILHAHRDRRSFEASLARAVGGP